MCVCVWEGGCATPGSAQTDILHERKSSPMMHTAAKQFDEANQIQFVCVLLVIGRTRELNSEGASSPHWYCVRPSAYLLGYTAMYQLMTLFSV